MKKTSLSENDVKVDVLRGYRAMGGWSYAPIQTGMGAHGIPDRVGCVPVVVTPEMVGKVVGLFVAVEAKKPGRRREKLAGATPAQYENLVAILDAAGIAVLADCEADMRYLATVIPAIQAGLNHTPLLQAALEKRTHNG